MTFACSLRHKAEGIAEARFRLTQSAVAFAIMCLTLFLMSAKIAAGLEKT